MLNKLPNESAILCRRLTLATEGANPGKGGSHFPHGLALTFFPQQTQVPTLTTSLASSN